MAFLDYIKFNDSMFCSSLKKSQVKHFKKQNLTLEKDILFSFFFRTGNRNGWVSF